MVCWTTISAHVSQPSVRDTQSNANITNNNDYIDNINMEKSYETCSKNLGKFTCSVLSAREQHTNSLESTPNSE